MAGSILHVYTSPVADGTATSVVRPSDWNSNHVYSGIQDAVSVVGNNTAGTPAAISSGTVYLAGGNNITLSQAGQSITISGATVAPAPVNVSAGTTSDNLATIVFSNSNGVSFGLNGSTVTATVQTNYLTTAMQSNAATISNVNVSAGTTSSNVSAVTFRNSNGVSFGYDGTNITATVATNYQSQGAYLTTAALSQDSSKYAGTNGAITGGSLTVNTSGVSINLPAYLTTAMQSNAVTLSNINVSAGTTSNLLSALTFANGNGISFGLNLSTVTASVAQSVQTQNCVDMTAAGNTSGTLALVSSGTLTLAGGNNITLSQVGNAITISGANAGGAQTAISGIADGAGTQTAGTLSFANSHGVTFGLSTGAQTGTITASVAAQTNQTLGLYATSNTTNNSSTTLDARSLTFQGAGGASVGYSNGSVQISAPVLSSLSATGWASLSANGNTLSIGASFTGNLYASSNTFGTSSGTADPRSVSIAGSGAVSVAASNSGWVISAPVQSNQTLSAIVSSNTAGNTSGMTFDARSVSFQGYGIASVGLSTTNTGSSILISASQSVQTQASGAIAGTGFTSAGNNVGISGTNNTAGLSLSVTVAAQSVQTQNCVDVTLAGNTSGTLALVSSGTLTLAGGNNVTLSQVGNAVTISAAGGGGGGNFSAGVSNVGNTAGNTGITGTRVVFAGGNNVTVSQGTDANGATVTISAFNQTNQTGGLYAVGNTFGTSSGTADARSVSMSGGSGIQVAASNGGWNVAEMPISVWEPMPLVTQQSFTSSHNAATWYVNRFVLPCMVAASNLYAVKSLSVGLPGATSQNSSGTVAYSYSHGVTVFVRQDYSNNSTNFTTFTTASMGLTAQLTYSSSSQSIGYSWVTDTTGGTLSFSTTSSSNGWSAYLTGLKQITIPCLTTFSQGEYFFAHKHSSTTGTTGSNVTLLSVSNMGMSVNVNVPLAYLNSSVVAQNSYLQPAAIGVGVISAVTTNNSMPMTVVSGNIQQPWYFNMSNC